MAIVRLADYRPAPYLLPEVRLRFQLHHDHALVSSELSFLPNPAADTDGDGKDKPLVLRGVDLSLLEISIDGHLLAAEDYKQEEDQLLIYHPPQRAFTLGSLVRNEPQRNTTLEGLYISGVSPNRHGMFTTQCEAEGFRRITFHPDRPDLLSRFQVRIEADQQTCPVLLSNGNCLEQGPLQTEPGAAQRHYALGEDPFPKPSYLFALVAGQLEEATDSFTTAHGRTVRLRIHVEPGDLPYVSHAMQSLKESMAWDEQVYGLEYDLEQYNIVAVRHFNMGAMENKSLNIFNSKLVLADAATATDGELEGSENVIAHEYFHNWTGNRITCRDWFQLSLKEGLTVFRDQCFNADLHGHAVSRIFQVVLLRNSQFREDAGPTAHPVQPDSYEAIDNFYTTTIYQKGAEVIRCLHTLLGEETFLQGVAQYVNRHDGSAATCDDFLRAMEDAATDAAEAQHGATFDFSQFRLWYHQAGTPTLRVKRHWDRQTGRLELLVSQHTDPTSGQPVKHPLVIPLAIGAVDQAGQPLVLRMAHETSAQADVATLRGHWGASTRLLVIDQETCQFVFEGLPAQSSPPALSLLRNFSAPVRLEIDRPARELVHLLATDSDPVARWDSGQELLRRSLLGRASGRIHTELEEELITAFQSILVDPQLSEASRSVLVTLPRLAELEAEMAEPDPPALFAALLALQRRFGEALVTPLHQALKRCQPQWTLPWPEGDGDRRLTSTAWLWRVAAGDSAIIQAARNAVEGPSMTLARAGLQALQCHPIPARQEAIDIFYKRWQHKPVILDSWFALEASAPFANGLERVERLLNHPRFDPGAPNSVRAVLGGLVGNTPVFHAADGSGYRFMAKQIADLDQRNPITASRMAKIFSRWRSYGFERREHMHAALAQLASGELSANTREVVEQCLQ